MAHLRAKLTEFGRSLIVQGVRVLGWLPAQAAAGTIVSQATVYKWLGRLNAEAGLVDRSSRPIRYRHPLPAREIARVLQARRRWK